MINLLNLFFPKVCESCSAFLTDNEDIICTDCRHDLPVTNFHISGDEAVKKILYGRAKLVDATALLHFSKGGKVQKLLHNLKYKGHEKIGSFLGDWLGEELRESNGFNGIDLVVPVPLHKTKLRKRGFNQVDLFGKALAQCINAKFDKQLLVKRFRTKTQVFKSRFLRFNDEQAQFVVSSPSGYNGKHILLVDDLITTGATIEKCVHALNEINQVKVSVATMAIAD